MYLAKSRGRGQAALFEPSMHAAALDRLELQNDLRHALERGELVVVYQPVHALESQQLVGAEALLRWIHPTRGPIPPTTFVPIAEETGLIVPIGRWVLHRACRDAVQWRARTAEGGGLRVSINMSSRQIPDVDLLEDIRSALRESGLPPGAVVLELTESMLLEHTAAMMTLMHRLRALGVRLAIDDFGTGYSSLSYLQRLPIDILKIDRAFVERLGTDANAAALVRAIVSLGESMSLKTIAEGIENAQQAERLRGLGCDFGQGFFYGMPMSAEELEVYIGRSMAVGVA
jgi:EAL domain-containing protein (putative c-di-GMP-specific phosphodiesterase class I)